MKTVIHYQTFQYPLKCSRPTHRNLDSFLEWLRGLWNTALEKRIFRYREQGVSVSYQDQCKDLAKLRQSDPKASQYLSDSQRSILNRLHKSFESFFRRRKEGKKKVGFPRFKGINRKVRSFEILKPMIKKVNRRYALTVKGVGKFRFKADSLPENIILGRVVVTARRVILQLVAEVPLPEPVIDERPPLGIDLGIKAQVTVSNGFQVPKRERNRQLITKRQRRFSKAKKGSHNYQRKKTSLAKAHQLIAEQERGFLHELTTFLIQHHSIYWYVEDLHIGNMVKNHFLARSILAQQWGLLIQLLTYKAEKAGGWVRKVNPKNTSQRCSGCGGMPAVKLTLKDRIYTCHHCGLLLDRDCNAACNVLQIGLAAEAV